jgi:hypothetical protein
MLELSSPAASYMHASARLLGGGAAETEVARELTSAGATDLSSFVWFSARLAVTDVL